MSTESFPGVKQPEGGVDHPPPFSAEVKERVELHFYFTCVFVTFTFTFAYLYFYVVCFEDLKLLKLPWLKFFVKKSK
jgi:hypothetical protein